MDTKEIDELHFRVKKKYLEYQLKDTEIIEKAIIFFNKYFNLTEHPFTSQDIEKLSNIDFSIKLDFLHWKSREPQDEQELIQFYRNTPFEFFKNLFKNMDVMHYEEILAKRILPELKKTKAKTVLDYAGGSGYQAILLHKLGFDVSFAELNKISIEWMRSITKELNFDIKIIDLEKEQIIENYDAIIIKDVIEHIPDPGSLLQILNKKTDKLMIFPDKMTAEEDYLPMHFCYEFNQA